MVTGTHFLFETAVEKILFITIEHEYFALRTDFFAKLIAKGSGNRDELPAKRHLNAGKSGRLTTDVLQENALHGRFCPHLVKAGS